MTLEQKLIDRIEMIKSELEPTKEWQPDTIDKKLLKGELYGLTWALSVARGEIEGTNYPLVDGGEPETIRPQVDGV